MSGTRVCAVVFLFVTLITLPVSGSITGVVMTRDGIAIAGAHVSTYALETVLEQQTRWMSKNLERKALTTGTTDAKGTFSIESPKDGVVDLAIEAKGFAPEMMRVERDQEAGAVVLISAPLHDGSVTAGGKPVAGAAVIYIGSGEFTTTTDAKGKYSVPNPAQWATRVVVLHPDYAVSGQTGLLGALRGEKLEVNRTLDPGVPVGGKVLARVGDSGVAGAGVTIDGWPLATSSSDGSFTIAHAPKKWPMLEVRSGDLVGRRAGSAKEGGAVRLNSGGTINGTVRDSRSQQPLGFAEVRVRSDERTRRSAQPALSVITDAKGNYAISGLSAGSYVVSVERPLYAVAQATVTIVAGQKVQKTLLAAAEARVSGTVSDEAKKPVVVARVSAQTQSRGNGFNRMFPMQSRSAAWSGPDGRFTLITPAEGEIQIDAARKGWPAGRSATFTLKAGDRKSGVTITIPRGIEVSGRVTDAAGHPLSGVAISTSETQAGGPGGLRRMTMMMPARGGQDDALTTATDGTFSVRVKEGTWNFAFKREGYAMKELRAVLVSSSAPPKPLAVSLVPGAEITGRVVRNGVGIEGVMVGGMSTENRSFTLTGPDGQFALTDLTAGPLMVNFNKDDEFITMMRSLNAPAKDVIIEVPAGGRVTGHVVDKATHQPITAFQAGLERSRSGGGMVMMMPPQLREFTSDDGSFVLENVPAGPIQVVANAAGHTTGRVPGVTVEDGKTVSNVEVALDAGVKLSGHVTGPDGAPLSGVNVRAAMDGNVVRFTPGEMTVTDSNGDYSLESLEAGDKTFTFSKSGFLNTTKSVQLSGTETQLDAQLGAGLHVTGVVTTDAGVPVPDADVRTSSAVAGSGGKSARTDSNGSFSMDGLAPGHYTFTASKAPYADGVLRDFDVSGGAQPRIALVSGATIYGHVTGLSDAEIAGTVVTVRGSSDSAEAPLDASGAFRVEGAPSGSVRVSADVRRGIAERRTSPVKTVDAAAGSPVQVDLEFSSQTTISGRVTRDGRPVINAAVTFGPKTGGATAGSTMTDGDGHYSVTGLSDGSYSVSAFDMQSFARYSTSYEVHGSGSFDIDMRTSSVRGTVLESGTDAPVADARVQFRRSSSDGGPTMNTSAVTDANGSFVVDSLVAGTYTAIADKQGYGNVTQDFVVSDASTPQNLQLHIAKNDGVVIQVLDARDQRPLDGSAVVFDAQNQPLNQPGFRFESSPDGVTLSLSPGQYRVVVWAYGYAPISLVVTSPSRPTVGLTPGGQMAISVKPGAYKLRIIDGSGSPYGRYFDSVGAIPLPGPTTFQNVAPGTYQVQLLTDTNAVINARTVTVMEGQLATVAF